MNKNKRYPHDDVVNAVNHKHIEIENIILDNEEIAVLIEPIISQGTFYLHFDKSIEGMRKIGLSLQGGYLPEISRINKIYNHYKRKLKNNIFRYIDNLNELKKHYTILTSYPSTQVLG